MQIIERIEKTMREIGARPWFSTLLSALGATAIVALWVFPQPPGVAVAALAVGALVVTFVDMKPTHKVLWVIFATLIFGLELRSIYSERSAARAESNAALSRMLEDNRSKTSAIIDNNNAKWSAVMSDNSEKFDSTVRTMSEISEETKSNLIISHRNLESVTGGDSYAYLYPRIQSRYGKVLLGLKLNGKNTLSGVHVDLYTITEPGWPKTTLDVGTVSPLSFRPEGISVPLPSFTQKKQNFQIFVSAQNGSIFENIGLGLDPATLKPVAVFRVYRITNPGEILDLNHISAMKLKPLMIHTDFIYAEGDDARPKH